MTLGVGLARGPPDPPGTGGLKVHGQNLSSIAAPCGEILEDDFMLQFYTGLTARAIGQRQAILPT